ncbi:hypothetical protein [Chlorogloeopsis sp. ULAP02]|uniref:hypothetical protein n=1 Tax=Chlorogloeopsis sp. ULAP02 TaxID=3107926 RepID=UPI00398AD5D9
MDIQTWNFTSRIKTAKLSRIFSTDNTLWVGTGNGVCQIKLQTADNPENWFCWRFAAMAKLPQAGLLVYSELSNQTPALTLSPTNLPHMQPQNPQPNPLEAIAKSLKYISPKNR